MRLRNRLVLAACVDNAGLSEREVARRAGLSHSTVNHLITGRRTTCTLSTAAAIARTVHCPIGALFTAETTTEQRSVNHDQLNYAPMGRAVTPISKTVDERQPGDLNTTVDVPPETTAIVTK